LDSYGTEKGPEVAQATGVTGAGVGEVMSVDHVLSETKLVQKEFGSLIRNSFSRGLSLASMHRVIFLRSVHMVSPETLLPLIRGPDAWSGEVHTAMTRRYLVDES
jgi:hypothetical protein